MELPEAEQWTGLFLSLVLSPGTDVRILAPGARAAISPIAEVDMSSSELSST